jgi:hypothetical protein
MHAESLGAAGVQKPVQDLPFADLRRTGSFGSISDPYGCAIGDYGIKKAAIEG